MIRSIQQGLLADGVKVPLTKLCAWFGVPRRTVYYKPTKAAPKVDPRFAAPIKAMIEQEPSFGYRTVAWLLGFNKNTVQRVFQLKGWQVRKRSIGARPRVQALPSVAQAPNERWATDLCRIWAGKDSWATLALVMDCHTREVLGWHLSKSGKAKTPVAALEQALIARFGTLGEVETPFLLPQRQRPGLHKSGLHKDCPQLRSEPGIHHPTLPTTERHDRTPHPFVERAMRPSPTLRKFGPRNPCDQRLGQLLQPQTPASGPCHADTN